ncbi:hypothetical protein OG21DRAFT_954293 [Imleria badia]|nr:hypothetical protein OG21DRAFT_954293 [Imleria badia]
MRVERDSDSARTSRAHYPSQVISVSSATWTGPTVYSSTPPKRRTSCSNSTGPGTRTVTAVITTRPADVFAIPSALKEHGIRQFKSGTCALNAPQGVRVLLRNSGFMVGLSEFARKRLEDVCNSDQVSGDQTSLLLICMDYLSYLIKLLLAPLEYFFFFRTR